MLRIPPQDAQYPVFTYSPDPLLTSDPQREEALVVVLIDLLKPPSGPRREAIYAYLMAARALLYRGPRHPFEFLQAP